MCFKCRQLSGEEVDSNMIVCDECGRIKAKESFENAMQEKWRTLSGEAVICKTCSVQHQCISASALIRCDGTFCRGKKVPEYHFVDELLMEWQAKKTYRIVQQQNKGECEKRKEQIACTIQAFFKCAYDDYNKLIGRLCLGNIMGW